MVNSNVDLCGFRLMRLLCRHCFVMTWESSLLVLLSSLVDSLRLVAYPSRLRDSGGTAKKKAEKKASANWKKTRATRALPSSCSFYFRVRSLIFPLPHCLRAWNRLLVARTYPTSLSVFVCLFFQ